MHLAVYLPLVIPVLAALAARPLADRLPPVAATWLLAGSSLALAAASSAVLGLLALSALVRIPLVAAVANMSVSAISRSDSVSLPIAIVAGGLLAAVAAAAARALWRRGTAIVAAGRQARRLPGSGQVVVTEDDAADAYTLPGWPCRIVITSGMLRALSAPERQVLLAHERAHAGGSHYLFTSAARLAAAANPLLRPVAAEVAYTVERWADERAAAATGDRPLTARAIARAALATSASPPGRTGPATALGLITQDEEGPGEGRHRYRRPSLRGAGPVPRRVAALLGPPPRQSLLLLAAALALVALSGASALDAARNLHTLVELAQAAHP
jgi:beta-lactamase regulating signal transducer with metallopeptidase domain